MKINQSRRQFVRSATGVLSGASLYSLSSELRSAIKEDEGSMLRLRRTTLDFIESMRVSDDLYGRYRYAAGMKVATLYSSAYAAMIRGLYGDLPSLSAEQKDQWVTYLQEHQDDDGLFRDPAIHGAGWYKDDPLWCGRPHLSCHVLTALDCLGAKPWREMSWLDIFKDPDRLKKWIAQRDWADKVAYSGNEILNVGTLLQYARDFQNDEVSGRAVDIIYEELEKRIDPKTGLWGGLDLEKPKSRSNAVMAAYHFWLLWFYDKRPIPHANAAVDNTLLTQNKQGGFGCGVHSPDPTKSSACEDIDSIDPLARLAVLNDYRRDDIRAALRKSLPSVQSNQMKDGGFVFVKDRAFEYGHPNLSAPAKAGAMFPTWFRTLSLAYLGEALPDSELGQQNWQFSNAPGMQFWRG